MERPLRHAALTTRCRDRAATFLAVLLIAGCGGAGPAPVKPSTEPPAWFQEITDDVKLEFRHDSGLDGSFYMPEIVGSGGAVFDYDGDGDLDVYLVNSGHRDAKRMGRSATTNRLFRREADGTFTDVTAASGLGDPGYGMGCAVGDIDNDGDPDVFVSNLGRDALYRNDGDGSFTNVTGSAGIRGERWSTSAIFFDYDLDGFLDLYVASYVNYGPPKACRHATGRLDYCGPANFAGVPDVLYRNQGDGTFRDVSAGSGIGRVASKSLGVYAADFDLDGDEDVYVANDGVANQLWVNLGGGRFEDRAVVLGAAFNIEGQPEASMGIAVGDIDRDGDLDLFMTHLDRETNTLYRNAGGEWFEDATAAHGLGAASLPFTGFGTVFFDYDHDGDLDLVAVNGRVRLGRDVPEQVRSEDPFRGAYAEPNQLFGNDGAGHFEDSSARAGRLTSMLEVTRSVIPHDYDGDGDLDVLLTNCNGPARLFLNEVPAKGHWLVLRALDPALKRDAIGALVKIETPSGTQLRHVTRTSSYLASRQPSVHFGLGGEERVEWIRVRWPGGSWEEFPGVAADQAVRLIRGRGEPLSGGS